MLSCKCWVDAIRQRVRAIVRCVGSSFASVYDDSCIHTQLYFCLMLSLVATLSMRDKEKLCM